MRTFVRPWLLADGPAFMEDESQASLFVPVLREQASELFLASTDFRAVSLMPPSEGLHRGDTLRTAEGASIYAVDDDEDLTELYTLLLAGAGYRVRAFNRRAQALAALRAEASKPALLITDYFGLSMHVHQFMHACRIVNPSLRILMASGVQQLSAGFSSVKPDRFIRKPFTPTEFLEEVKAALVCPSRSRIQKGPSSK